LYSNRLLGYSAGPVHAKLKLNCAVSCVSPCFGV
jgi:hypothetical protein